MNAPPLTNPIFVIGCQRSGTTFLGSVLGAHPACLCIPEFSSKFNPLHLSNPPSDVLAIFHTIVNDWRFRIWEIKTDFNRFANWVVDPSLSSLLEWIVYEYGRQVAKANYKYWVDHTPTNMDYVAELDKLYPAAKFIHIIRDGRAIFSSTKQLAWGPCTPNKAAVNWMKKISKGLAVETYLPADRIMRISYEDLVADIEAVSKKLCDFLTLDYCKSMETCKGFKVPNYTIKQHKLVGTRPDRSRLDNWQEKLSAKEIEHYENIACALLTYLKYKPIYGMRANPPNFITNQSYRIRSIIKEKIIQPRYELRNSWKFR